MLQIIGHTRYGRAGIEALLAQRLHALGVFTRLRQRGKRVLLKPNFVMPAPPDDASTTHPDVYMAIAGALLHEGFEVGIGESPTFGSCARALRAHGVLDECRERGIEVVEFRTPTSVPGVADARHYQHLTQASELGAWDALINVPKLKTHRQFTFTGAVKNLYGCVVGKRKFIRHNLCGNDPVRFAKMLLANARAADAVLHIGDGIEAMHVMGPRGGEPYPLGALLIADDALEHDWLMCHLIGLAPATTPLFAALDEAERCALDRRLASILAAAPTPARDFVHAPLIHISFSPMAIARSGLRTLRYKLAGH